MWWRTKFADTNSIPKQLLHIASELWEIVKAYIKGDIGEMKMESMDLIQSVYTLLHKLGMTEVEHERTKWEMQVKNHRRGYYKKESPCKG